MRNQLKKGLKSAATLLNSNSVNYGKSRLSKGTLYIPDAQGAVKLIFVKLKKMELLVPKMPQDVSEDL